MSTLALPSFNVEAALPAIYEAAPPVIANNTIVRQAWALAELSLDAITPDQLTARINGADTAALLADPEIAALVEKFSGRADVQNAALDAQLRRAMKASISVLSMKLDDPECSATAARDASETLVKVSNLLDKRSEVKWREPGRRLFLFYGNASVFTPEGESSFYIDSPEAIVHVISAMRCTKKAEVEAVLDVFRTSLFSGEITLRGW